MSISPKDITDSEGRWNILRTHRIDWPGSSFLVSVGNCLETANCNQNIMQVTKFVFSDVPNHEFSKAPVIFIFLLKLMFIFTKPPCIVIHMQSASRLLHDKCKGLPALYSTPQVSLRHAQLHWGAYRCFTYSKEAPWVAQADILKRHLHFLHHLSADVLAVTKTTLFL